MDDASPAGMNFELPEELRMLKETVRKFVDRELIPIERQACDGHKLKPEIRSHLEAKAQRAWPRQLRRAAGIWRARPRAARQAVVWAEMARSIALPSRASEIFGPNVSPILYHLDDAQKRRFLLPDHRGRAATGASPRPSPTPAAIPAACARPRCARATITSSPA